MLENEHLCMRCIAFYNLDEDDIENAAFSYWSKSLKFSTGITVTYIVISFFHDICGPMASSHHNSGDVVCPVADHVSVVGIQATGTPVKLRHVL